MINISLFPYHLNIPHMTSKTTNQSNAKSGLGVRWKKSMYFWNRNKIFKGYCCNHCAVILGCRLSHLFFDSNMLLKKESSIEVHISYLARLMPFQHFSSAPVPVATLSLQRILGREIQYGCMSLSLMVTSDTWCRIDKSRLMTYFRSDVTPQPRGKFKQESQK